MEVIGEVGMAVCVVIGFRLFYLLGRTDGRRQAELDAAQATLESEQCQSEES
jgi:hypothetical protein